jgi:hypothetical protein
MNAAPHFLVRCPKVLVALGLWTLTCATGCGGATHLFYNAREMRHEPFTPKHQGVLAAEVAKKADGKNVEWVDEDGQIHQLKGDESSLKKLGLAELAALYLATHGGERGGEQDIRVHLKNKKSRI